MQPGMEWNFLQALPKPKFSIPLAATGVHTLTPVGQQDTLSTTENFKVVAHPVSKTPVRDSASVVTEIYPDTTSNSHFTLHVLGGPTYSSSAHDAIGIKLDFKAHFRMPD